MSPFCSCLRSVAEVLAGAQEGLGCTGYQSSGELAAHSLYYSANLALVPTTQEVALLLHRRTGWAVFNLCLFLAVLGVIGTGTWALVEGLKSTDGKTVEFWNIVATAKTKVNFTDLPKLEYFPAQCSKRPPIETLNDD